MLRFVMILILMALTFACHPCLADRVVPANRAQLLLKRQRTRDYVQYLLDTIDERYATHLWRIPPGQSPNLRYQGEYQYIKEEYIDDKDRYDIEKAYLLTALSENFFLGPEFEDYIETLENLTTASIENVLLEERRIESQVCSAAALRVEVQSFLDALPLVAGLQAELLDRNHDRNFHSPESFASGVFGGILGSILAPEDPALWAVRRISMNENLGVNSPCFITRRRIEALYVESFRRH